MKYKVIRNEKYDYIGQSYSSVFPNLHKYPATMLPQIGIDILDELNINNGVLLDPYCGSGSTFACGLARGLKIMDGFDLNPLAVIISKAKFTKIPINDLLDTKKRLRNNIFEYMKDENNLRFNEVPKITNIDFWFSKNVIIHLSVIKKNIEKIKDKYLYNFFLVPFSETVRECSYTRNNEFKLYKMKSEDVLKFNPDVISIYFDKLEEVFFNYTNYYLPYIEESTKIEIYNKSFISNDKKYNLVLTSPPYGDSRTTVAYGQFSTLSNEWLGIEKARQIDKMLMGGSNKKDFGTKGLIADYINEIEQVDKKRALEVSSFYTDLQNSISEVSKSIKSGGKAIYLVGNRTVKGIQLPTDQFIAEKFEENGFKHLLTYERAISNKSMPVKNSPSNKIGKTLNTMLNEYIVVCEKKGN